MKPGQHRDLEAIYEDTQGQKTKRRGINSVENGIQVLEALIALKHPATLKDIAERAQLDTSQAHRYLSSLVNSGLLQQSSVSGRYDLGHKALKIGLSALSRLDPIAIISTAAEELAAECGHTCLLSIWGSNGPVIIRWYAGSPPVYTTLSIGSVLPVTQSATGKVFMSFLADNYLNPHLQAEGWKMPLNKNPQLQEIRSQVRETLMSGVDNTFIPGLRAYSAPVFGVHHSVLGALTVVGSQDIPKSEDRLMKKNLAFLCQRLTDQLGGDWP